MASILLVESDPDTRDRMAALLVGARHDVLVALTMREAFLQISEGGIDLVVIDAYDPRVGVVELARSMQALPDAPPIMLVSGSPHAPEISARIGAAELVLKPYEARELLATMTRLLEKHRPIAVFEDEPTGTVRQLG